MKVRSLPVKSRYTSVLEERSRIPVNSLPSFSFKCVGKNCGATSRFGSRIERRMAIWSPCWAIKLRSGPTTLPRPLCRWQVAQKASFGCAKIRRPVSSLGLPGKTVMRFNQAAVSSNAGRPVLIEPKSRTAATSAAESGCAPATFCSAAFAASSIGDSRKARRASWRTAALSLAVSLSSNAR